MHETLLLFAKHTVCIITVLDEMNSWNISHEHDSENGFVENPIKILRLYLV